MRTFSNGEHITQQEYIDLLHNECMLIREHATLSERSRLKLPLGSISNCVYDQMVGLLKPRCDELLIKTQQHGVFWEWVKGEQKKSVMNGRTGWYTPIEFGLTTPSLYKTIASLVPFIKGETDVFPFPVS